MSATTELVQSTVVGAMVAGASPLAQAFDESALVIAIFGALGGSARWLFLQEGLREGGRLAILGALLAFGMGNLWSIVIKNWLGDVPDHVLTQPETAYYGAFLVGLSSVAIMGRFIDGGKKDE